MNDRFRSYRKGIRFFPHIIPIAFPLIFPFGLFLALALFRLVLPVAVILLIVVLAVLSWKRFRRGAQEEHGIPC